MIDWAKANGTKVLLIAGDLIDDAAAVPRTAQYLSDLFLSAPGIHFFISPGNHDFYGPKSMYRLCDWPGNVKIFTGGIERVDVPACNLCVYGAGFSAEYADLGPFSGISGSRVRTKSK